MRSLMHVSVLLAILGVAASGCRPLHACMPAGEPGTVLNIRLLERYDETSSYPYDPALLRHEQGQPTCGPVGDLDVGDSLSITILPEPSSIDATCKLYPGRLSFTSRTPVETIVHDGRLGGANVTVISRLSYRVSDQCEGLWEFFLEASQVDIRTPAPGETPNVVAVREFAPAPGSCPNGPATWWCYDAWVISVDVIPPPP